MSAIARNHVRSIVLKGERLEARVSGEQKKFFQHAAMLLGRTLTDFIVSSLQEAATRVIQAQEVLTLTAQDREIFVRTLLAPPRPNKALLRAAKRYREKLVA